MIKSVCDPLRLTILKAGAAWQLVRPSSIENGSYVYVFLIKKPTSFIKSSGAPPAESYLFLSALSIHNTFLLLLLGLIG